jgi:hypothetical protein
VAFLLVFDENVPAFWYNPMDWPIYSGAVGVPRVLHE